MLEKRRNSTATRPPMFDAWIDMYGGPDFAAAVARYRALVEAAARATPEHVPQMADHFRTSCHLENMFWTQAQDTLAWPDDA